MMQRNVALLATSQHHLLSNSLPVSALIGTSHREVFALFQKQISILQIIVMVVYYLTPHY